MTSRTSGRSAAWPEPPERWLWFFTSLMMLGMLSGVCNWYQPNGTMSAAEMTELHAEFPVYSWNKNAGYGTAEHLKALRDHGPCVHHRRSFGGV